MALIENAQGRGKDQSPSGYTRIFGVAELGQLMSRVQGTVISAGSELERMIWERVEKIQDLDTFIDFTLSGGADKLFVARKPQIKASKKIASKYEPDFVAFNPHQRKCYVIEVKDGDQFDTKKASGEHASIHNFATDISQALPFTTEIFLCSFNARTKDEIFYGLKERFHRKELLTGQELCELLAIDYSDIVQKRKAHEDINLNYFIMEMLRINPVRALIVQHLEAFQQQADEPPPPVEGEP